MQMDTYIKMAEQLERISRIAYVTRTSLKAWDAEHALEPQIKHSMAQLVSALGDLHQTQKGIWPEAKGYRVAVCHACGKAYQAQRQHAKYCSSTCRYRAEKRAYRARLKSDK